MSDLLEQLGMTKEEIIDRLVDKALAITVGYTQVGEEEWESLPLSTVVDKKIDKALGAIVAALTPIIQRKMEEIMNKRVEEVFTLSFQPIDQFGQPKGPVTTIRDMIADSANRYWTTKVDSNGKEACGGYGTYTERAVYYANQVMRAYYDTELLTEVKRLAAEMKAQIPATIATEITVTVVKYLH